MEATSASRLRSISRLAAWLPLILTFEKKRPPRLAGAINARSAFMPECDSTPLTTQTAPDMYKTSVAGTSSATTTTLAYLLPSQPSAP